MAWIRDTFGPYGRWLFDRVLRKGRAVVSSDTV